MAVVLAMGWSLSLVVVVVASLAGFDGMRTSSGYATFRSESEDHVAATTEKLSVALSPELAGLVREAVATGEYASSAEVIREALREWKLRRTLAPQETEALRRLWDEGIASGPGRFQDMAGIKAEARRQLKGD